jgi:nicotinamide-nucleotide amidase
MSLRIETIAIGDEILTGKISDSNSTFVANGLFQRGFPLQRQNVVADDLPAMTNVMREVAKRADFVACFGGLGPTSDDKTAECVAALLGSPIVEHAPSKEKLLAYYAERNRAVTSQSLKQVLYPGGASPLLNNAGMAPGFSCAIEGCRFFFFPGVPSEMRPMVSEYFFPEVERVGNERIGQGRMLSHAWWCLGIWESELQRVMDPVEAALPSGAYLGYRTRPPENHLSLYYRVRSSDDEKKFEALKVDIRERLARWTYTEETKDFERLIADKLEGQKARIALAESCTGGLVAERLTRIPGSSDRIWGGFVCYQIDAKNKMLGVSLEHPDQAVSADCTRRLAEACKQRSGCEIGAAVTGYLGPTGGTEADPVGTVYIAVSGKKLIEQRVTVSTRTREEAKWSASTYLLNAIRLVLES